MAIGKVFTYRVDIASLKILFGKGIERTMIDAETIDRDEVPLDAISEMLKRDEVHIEVILGNGPYSETVWGCDLTEGYIMENAHYTT